MIKNTMVFLALLLVSWAPIHGAKSASCERILLAAEESLPFTVHGTRSVEAKHCFVLLPGLDRNQTHWSEVLGALKKLEPQPDLPRCFITVDLLGQGQSNHPIDAHSEINVHDQTSALVKTLRRNFAQVETFTLVAHSYSALVATALLHDYPSFPIKQLMLLSPYVDFTESHHPHVGRFFDIWRSIAMMVGLGPSFENGIQLGSMAGGAPIWQLHRAKHNVDASLEQVMALTRGARRESMKTLARRVTHIPVHVVHGRLEEMISRRAHYELYRSFASGNPHAHWHQILSNHDMIIEHPHKVAEFILANDDSE